MPTYQYRCTECGHDLEAVQKFTDAALTECPNCGGPLRKIFNAVGVVFKGSGFYRTDSRAKDTKGSSDSSGKSETSGDKAAKPEKSDKKESAATGGTSPKSDAGGSSGSSKQPTKAASSTGGGA